jgi:PqqD family protein of HPr-rel-A system
LARRASHERPIARSEGLLIEEVGDETVIYDERTGDAHCLSPLAAAVIAHCNGSHSLEALATLAGSSLGEPVDVERVDAALAQLEERDLLVPPPLGISRRTLVRRTAAVTAAVTAGPMITSIVTPAFAQTQTYDRRCPGSRCVSQSEGDVYCGCNNACPAGSPGAGSPSTCTSQGLTPPFFDSCFCAQCPKPGDPNPGQVPPMFAGLCLPPGQQTTPCGGGGTPNMGCNDPTKHLDGICVPNDGDSSETCLHP